MAQSKAVAMAVVFIVTTFGILLLRELGLGDGDGKRS